MKIASLLLMLSLMLLSLCFSVESNMISCKSQTKISQQNKLEHLINDLKKVRAKENSIIKLLIMYKDSVTQSCSEVQKILCNVIETDDELLIKDLMDIMEIETYKT